MILVDSDVLIEHLRGKTAARDWLVNARRSSGPLAISVVSQGGDWGRWGGDRAVVCGRAV